MNRESRVICIKEYYFQIITKWPEQETGRPEGQEVVSSIRRISRREAERTPEILSMPSPLQEETARQLREYFEGKRKKFDLPIEPEGTEFQRRVWKALLKIPYGETKSYQEIAQEAGSPKGFRAVGMANHKNPIIIVIPCHRVIGKDGSLTGYGGGLELKEELLALEKKYK